MIRARRLVIVAAGLLIGASAPPLSPADQAAIARAEARGKLIYDFDQAAWVATDALMQATHGDPGPTGARGWIVEENGRGQRVIFYRLAPATAAFTAEVKDHKVVSSHLFAGAESPPLTEVEQRLAQAREAIAKTDFPRCEREKPFNTVVLPPEAPDEAVPVYLLTPQVRTGEYPIGGYYEADIAADGKVVKSRPFTKGCLREPMPAKAAAAMVTHLLDPTPTEIHVYLALWIGKPLFVGTRDRRIWKVERDSIQLLDLAPKR